MIRRLAATLCLAGAWTTLAAAERPVDAAKIRAAAERVEPSLVGSPERLPQYVAAFRKQFVDEPRLCLFDVTAAPGAARGVVLTGYVELAEARTAVAAFLATLGFGPVDNQIELLPAAALGDERFALVARPHAYCYEQAVGDAVATDAFLGEGLLLLRADQDRLLVHCDDGYLGWIDAAAVRRVAEPAYNAWAAGPTVVVHRDCQAASGQRVPAGARLRLLRRAGDRVVAESPASEELDLPADACAERHPPDDAIESIIAHARTLLGVDYVWGGRTAEGIDCSGLVQTSFARAGVRLPRDASQQFQVGRLTGTRWWTAAMRRGDTMYFVDPQGHVSHTAVYLGGGEYIHACPPRATINSLDPQAPTFNQTRRDGFAFARRPLD